MSANQKIQVYREFIKQNRTKLLSLSTVHGISIGRKKVNELETEQIAIVAHVYKKLENRQLKESEIFERVVAEIDGSVETDVQVKSLPVEEFLKVPKERVEVIVDINKYRPLLGGSRVATESTDYYHYGTGGFVGTSTGASNKKCLVTNYHVVRESIDNKVYQPSVAIENLIGDVGNTAYSAKVDGAIIKLKSNIGTENKIIEIGTVSGTKDPELDDEVVKYGFKTQLTSGKITNLSYAGTTSGGREFEEQIVIGKRNISDPPLSDSGDSGSAWVLSDGNKIEALHWGGDGSGDDAYASPIGDVENELSVVVSTE